MQSILTAKERHDLKHRPRKRVHVRARKAFTVQQAATRPGELAKMRTLDVATKQIVNQIERYGFSDGDERRLRRTVAFLQGILEVNNATLAFPPKRAHRKAG